MEDIPGYSGLFTTSPWVPPFTCHYNQFAVVTYTITVHVDTYMCVHKTAVIRIVCKKVAGVYVHLRMTVLWTVHVQYYNSTGTREVQ